MIHMKQKLLNQTIPKFYQILSKRKLNNLTAKNGISLVKKKNLYYKQLRNETNKSLNWFIQPQREKDEASNTINFKQEKSILKSTSKGSYYHEKLVLGYSREQMCDLVFDVEKYKLFLPFCLSSEILKEESFSQKPVNLRLLKNQSNKTDSTKTNLYTPSSYKAKLEIGYPPIRESYISHVSMIRPQIVKAISRDTTLFEYLINEWKFHPYNQTSKSNYQDINKLNDENKIVMENCCIVEFYVSFKFRSAIYSKFSNLFMDQVYKKMLTAFIKRAFSLYGKPSIEPKNLT